MSKMSTCTLCKSLVMTRQGSRNRWVTVFHFGREIFVAYSMASVLYSSSRMKIPNLRRPRSLQLLIVLGRAVAQWYRVLDSRPRGRGFDHHRRNCVVSLSKNINPSLVLVQRRKPRPFITERLLMGRKYSNQANKQN